MLLDYKLCVLPAFSFPIRIPDLMPNSQNHNIPSLHM